MKNKFNLSLLLFLLSSVAILTLTGCKDEVSYGDLLRDEEKAVNWYLAQQNVETEVPSDSIFVAGEDAPYYRMDDDGHVYMQVVNPGDTNDRPNAGDKVYFRFSRRNLKVMYEGGEAAVEGNLDNMNSALGPTSFFYGNTTYPTTTQYGTGLQIPMDYLGYYSEVNLVLKSYAGFTTDQSQCVPYVMNVKYYRAEY